MRSLIFIAMVAAWSAALWLHAATSMMMLPARESTRWHDLWPSPSPAMTGIASWVSVLVRLPKNSFGSGWPFNVMLTWWLVHFDHLSADAAKNAPEASGPG